jgi:hypothetical protein
VRIVVDASGLASASQEARDYFRSVIRNLIAQGSAHSLALAGWPGDACGDPASFLAPLPRVGAAWTVVRDPQDRAASVVFSPLGPHRLACLEFVPAVATILDPPPSPLEARTLRSWTRRPGTKLVTLTRASLDLLVGSVGVPASRVAWIPPGAGLTAGWEAPAEDGRSLPSSPYIVTSGTGETRGFSDLVEGLHLYRRTWSRDVRLLVLERAPKSWERLAARRGLFPGPGPVSQIWR